MNTYGQYKLEFRVWNGSAYVWSDYTSRLVSFDSISTKMESGATPNSFTASMSSIVVDNNDGFWSGVMDSYLINSSEAYGKEFRKRQLRISEITTDGVTTNTRYLFTGLVDDLTFDNKSGTAKIAVISLDRAAMEQACDGEKINDTEIGGAWGTGKLYEDRDKNDNNGNYSYTWFTDKKYTEILDRISEALGDSDTDIDLIERATTGGRRVCSTRKNITQADMDVGVTIFWSPLHNELIIPYETGGTPSYVKFYSYNIETDVLTLRYTSASYGEDACAFWYNEETEKVFFIMMISTTYYLCQLNSDWSVVTQALSVTGFIGNVCYSQIRNSGDGSVFLGTSTSNNIYEYACDDITSGLSLLNNKAAGYPTYKIAVSPDGETLAFVAPSAADTDDIYIGDISTSTWDFYILFDGATGVAVDALHLGTCHDTTDLHLTFIQYLCATKASYKVSYYDNTDLVAGIGGAGPVTAADIHSSIETYRALGGFIEAADGLYFFEHSLYGQLDTYPAKPTYLLSIKDTAETTAVYENLCDPSAAYGEYLVDGELDIAVKTVKAANKNAVYYIGVAYKPGTDWAFYSFTPVGELLFQYAKTISPYIRLCDFSGLSAWQLRKLLAERFGAVMFYGGDGTFYFKDRDNAGSVSYNLTAPLISMKTAGYKSIKNVIRAVPYTLPYGQVPDIEIKPWGITHPTSTIGIGRIKIGGSTTNTSRWRIIFTTATAFSIQEETAVGVWTARQSGTKGTNVIYSAADAQFTIDGGDWTGTAVAGDEFQFWSHKSQKQLTKLGEVERIEALDATSIAAYQRSEMNYDNRFTTKVCLLDIVTNILEQWKNPKRILAISQERDADYKIWDVVTIVDDFLGYTTSDNWSITGLKLGQGRADIEIELTEVL